MFLLNGPEDDPTGLQIDWSRFSAGNFPYRIRQRPGPDNPLGQVKLEMPNSFDVYLHDTPGKAAFSQTVRALSHGCIRVEQILPLAAIALGGDAAQAITELNEAIATGMTQRIRLAEPLPVYVLYWTAWVDANQTMQFRPDVYRRDGSLVAAIAAARSAQPIAFYSGRCDTATG
jgi:murein L,D-transpeptidase YcbB/YkuD